MNSYHAFAKKTYPGFTNANFDDGFLYNYYQATKALVAGLNASAGATGAKLQQALPKTLSAPFNISNRGNVKLDANRQAIQDQWPVQIVQGANGLTVTAHRLRAERRPVVRRALQEVEPAARSYAASVREEEAAVAGQDPCGEERRRHQLGHQVRQ